MHSRKHTKFITSPISTILNEATSASAGIGDGIETFPLCDYVMQSLLLRMTGSQEQKMKCICWEMATIDYEYRYEFTKNPLGECSSYKDKQEIYKTLIKQMEKRGFPFDKLNINNDKILKESLDSVINAFSESNLSTWMQKSFLEFIKISETFKENHFASKDAIFTGKPLKDVYEKYLYTQRNRIAHNTISYQENLPTLKTLADADYRFSNYFIFFFSLILIDRIFIALYNSYLTAVDNNEI